MKEKADEGGFREREKNGKEESTKDKDPLRGRSATVEEKLNSPQPNGIGHHRRR